uniref:Uncharacterized protein n=1 Tax=Anguilla anguilla TaxID=7936 RepID=A0A0E9X724_ANGAN
MFPEELSPPLSSVSATLSIHNGFAKEKCIFLTAVSHSSNIQMHFQDYDSSVCTHTLSLFSYRYCHYYCCCCYYYYCYYHLYFHYEDISPSTLTPPI